MATLVRSLYVNSTNVFQHQLFWSDADIAVLPDIAEADKYISTASITLDLKDSEGELVIDGLALDFVTGSDGYYRGEDPPNELIILGEQYEWIVTVTISGKAQEFSGFIRAERNPGRDVA